MFVQRSKVTKLSKSFSLLSKERKSSTSSWKTWRSWTISTWTAKMLQLYLIWLLVLLMKSSSPKVSKGYKSFPSWNWRPSWEGSFTTIFEINALLFPFWPVRRYAVWLSKKIWTKEESFFSTSSKERRNHYDQTSNHIYR